MEIIRKIGSYDVLIDTNNACDIALEAGVAAQLESEEPRQITRKKILNLLASGDEYYPLTMRWELLDKCNFSCPFCYIVGHSSNRVVRFAEIKKHLVDLVDAGLLFCTLTGGEVTIHPDFEIIYSFLKEAGVVVDVFTNGLAIDDEIENLFRRLPPATLEVSIYSLDNRKLRDEYLVKSEKAATAVLENVLKLKRAGINVICKTFLNKVTQPDIARVIEWCDENGIEHYSSSSITNGYDGSNLGSFLASKEDLIEPRIPSKPPVCLPCKTKNYGSAIDSAFFISPCPSIRLTECSYDLRDLGVKESLRRMKGFMRRFQDSEIEGAANKGKPCATCIAYAKPVRNEGGELTHFSQW